MNPKTEAKRAAKEYVKLLGGECHYCMGNGDSYEEGFHAGEKSERVIKLVEAVRLVIEHEDFDTVNPEFGKLLDSMADALAEFEGEK